MSSYVFIESRDPFEGADVVRDYELASSLAKQGNKVTVFLVQNGVLPARAGAASERLLQLRQDGVEVLADDFSLRERGIVGNKLVRDVRPAALEVVIDRLASGSKTVWL